MPKARMGAPVVDYHRSEYESASQRTFHRFLKCYPEWTHDHIGKRLGCAGAYISALRHGDRTPSRALATRIQIFARRHGFSIPAVGWGS
jgi:hypothetical protein